MEQQPQANYELALKEFIEGRGWQEEPDVNPDTGDCGMMVSVTIGELDGGRLLIHGSDANGLLRVVFFYPFRPKETKLAELCLLFNHIHGTWTYGRFEVDDDREICWSHQVDFEGLVPNGKAVENIVSLGWNAAARFAEVIAAVALTNQGADEAWAEWLQGQESAEKEGPEEL